MDKIKSMLVQKAVLLKPIYSRPRHTRDEKTIPFHADFKLNLMHL